MGKRFIVARYQFQQYSPRRVFLRLNEGDFEPHRMRAYGWEAGGFTYRQIFQKRHASNASHQRLERSFKKAARRHVQRGLHDE